MNTMHYMQKATEAAYANGEVLKSMFDVSLTATQQLVSRNGDFVRALVQTGGAPAGEAGIGKQMTEQAQRLEQVGEYLRDVNDILIKTQSDVARLNAQRLEALTDTLLTQFGELVRPERLDASDIAEAMKATLNTAGAAYEQIIDTARKVTESSLAATMRSLQPGTPRAAARVSARSQRAA